MDVVDAVAGECSLVVNCNFGANLGGEGVRKDFSPDDSKRKSRQRS